MIIHGLNGLNFSPSSIAGRLEWNDIVRVFRTGMPIGRHWRQLRSHEDCFVASEAVDWLYEFLQHHHDSGPELTRPQVVKLLQKFQRNSYIEDVRGSKYNSELFGENNRLFRFVALSPLKTPQWPRTKSAAQELRQQVQSNKQLSDLKTNNIFKELEPSSDRLSSDSGSLQSQENRNPALRSSRMPAQNMKLTTENTELLWKTVILERLRKVLSVPEEILSLPPTTTAFKHTHVKHNMTVLHKNGYVTGIGKSELPPAWVITAMRYLAKWPDKENESFPDYPGFEKDVFVMIKDYFETLRQPLTTHALYPVLLQVYRLVDEVQPSPIERKATRVLHVSETTPQKHRHTQHNYNGTSGAVKIHPSKYSSRYPENSGNSLRCCVTSKQTANLNPTTSEDLIVVYDVSENQEQPLQRQKVYQYEQRSNSSGHNSSYKEALDIDISDKYANNVYGRGKLKNSSSKPDLLRCGVTAGADGSQEFLRPSVISRQPQQLAGTMPPRSASLSHLLVGPRVETAFVGDDAYTVYYGAARAKARAAASNQPSYMTRAQSVYGLNRYAPAANHSGIPTHRVPSTSNLLTTQTVSERYIVPSSYRSREEGSHPAAYSYYNTATRTQSSTSVPSSSCYNLADQLPKHYYPREYNSRPAPQERAEARPASELYTDTGSIRLKFHSTPSTSVDNSLPYGLFDEEFRSRLLKSLQLILLFLPPSNRRILHMLLKLLHKTSTNNKLVMDAHMSNKRLVVQSLWRCVMSCKDEAETDIAISMKVVQFLVENYEEIFKVPMDLRHEIEVKIAKANAPVAVKVTQPVVLRSRTNLTAPRAVHAFKSAPIPPKAIDRLGITPGKVYCEQITTEQYKTQATLVFDSAMRELLANIVDDRRMTTKEKAKRLKQFGRTYPEIFAERFPDQAAVKYVLEEYERRQPKVKPVLLSRPINLLKKLR